MTVYHRDSHAVVTNQQVTVEQNIITAHLHDCFFILNYSMNIMISLRVHGISLLIKVDNDLFNALVYFLSTSLPRNNSPEVISQGADPSFFFFDKALLTTERFKLINY